MLKELHVTRTLLKEKSEEIKDLTDTQSKKQVSFGRISGECDAQEKCYEYCQKIYKTSIKLHVTLTTEIQSNFNF